MPLAVDAASGQRTVATLVEVRFLAAVELSPLTIYFANRFKL